MGQSLSEPVLEKHTDSGVVYLRKSPKGSAVDGGTNLTTSRSSVGGKTPEGGGGGSEGGPDSPCAEGAGEDREDGDRCRIPWAMASMQGHRNSQEDAHLCCSSVPGFPNVAAFGVFDGHSGDVTSQLVAEKLLEACCEREDFSPIDDPQGTADALRQAFFTLDADLRKIHRPTCGSTASVVFVTPTHYIFANCGDSRCLLIRQSEVWGTLDHKPSNALEKSRIVKAGAHVSLSGRVNGMLALSRAFGDFQFKRQDLSQSCQAVSVEPDVTVMPRLDDDQFVLVGCDGVFDVMDNKQIMDWLVTRAKKGGSDPLRTAKALIQEAFERGSTDNISAIVLYLPGAPSPPPDTVARFEAEELAAEAKSSSEKPDAVHFSCAVNQPPAQILKPADDGNDTLYIGSLENAENVPHLRSIGVEAVLNVAAECGNPCSEVEELVSTHVRLEDESSFDLLSVLPDCHEFIGTQLEAKRPLLVYCMAGKSRSVAVVVSFLMKTKRWGLSEAYTFVKSRHPFIFPGPNAGFMEQLSKYEETLFPRVLEADALDSVKSILEVVVGPVPKVLLRSKLRMQYLHGGSAAVESEITPPAEEPANRVECGVCHKLLSAAVLPRHLAMHRTQEARQKRRALGLALAAKEDALAEAAAAAEAVSAAAAAKAEPEPEPKPEAVAAAEPEPGLHAGGPEAAGGEAGLEKDGKEHGQEQGGDCRKEEKEKEKEEQGMGILGTRRGGTGDDTTDSDSRSVLTSGCSLASLSTATAVGPSLPSSGSVQRSAKSAAASSESVAVGTGLGEGPRESDATVSPSQASRGGPVKVGARSPPALSGFKKKRKGLQVALAEAGLSPEKP